MQLNEHQRNSFLEVLWRSYDKYGRNLPWRQPKQDGTLDPYSVMVSELMLQQTQVPRVVPKYEEFLRRFPNTSSLASVDLGEVLRLWQGLGYNRRAKFLWRAAQAIEEQGSMPSTLVDLIKLPGIGKNTAGAILAYAYNQPAIFIETNIRTVYIYHFLTGNSDVADSTITQLLEQTIDREHPREFYWALMDYGTYLKATVGNLNRISKQYSKQSAFKGSRRQIRGQVLRLLGQAGCTLRDLQGIIMDERLEGVLNDLTTEGLIHNRNGMYTL